MKNQILFVVAGLCVVAAAILSSQDASEYRDGESGQVEFIEVATILWKAHIYVDEIKFVSNERVFHTTRFGIGEKHIHSASFRNLDGYFDPVFVTVWRRAQSYKAIIIDPVRENNLLQVEAESEIYVSVSPKNKILLTYANSGQGSATQNKDYVFIWPPPN